MNSLRRAVGAAIGVPALLLTMSSSVLADSHMMDCSVEINRTEIGFIVTVGGGKGVLTCGSKTYPFRVGGFQVGGMGLAGHEMKGTVKLAKVSDFEGGYTRGEAGITAIKGAGTTTLTNENGVKMTLSIDSAGADVRFGGGGIQIDLE